MINMPPSSQGDDESNYQLVVKIDNVKNIYFLLKAISFQEKATCFATDNGLKITVEDLKCIQANAFIQVEIFQEYHLNDSDGPVTFSLDLNVLLECLNIFGAATLHNVSTALKLCYRGHGYPVQLLLEEDGVLTDCSIRTLELQDLLSFNFPADNTVNKVILTSDPVKDIFSVLDQTSDMFEVLLSPEEPYIRFTTIGNTGECQIEIPKDSDIVEAFQCTTTSKSSVCQ
ncbi:hypothetical protein B566_EDAN014367 [Ephemera danica]|nr:hypothetical protein B566_EDAN014367 [Ephemera danica]